MSSRDRKRITLTLTHAELGQLLQPLRAERGVAYREGDSDLYARLLLGWLDGTALPPLHLVKQPGVEIPDDEIPY